MNMRDERLMVLPQKDFSQINIKTHTNIPIDKWTKDTNRRLTKDKIHMESLLKRSFNDVRKYLK